MTPTEDPSDEELAHRLRDALALRDAPEPWIRRATALWQARAAPGPLRRLLAVLSVDSWAPAPGLLAFRGAQRGPRQLLFNAAGRDIDLRIATAGDRHVLSGQVLGPDESGTVLVSPVPPTEGGAQTATLDSMGEFRVPSLASGRYACTFRFGDEEIALPEIEVRGRDD